MADAGATDALRLLVTQSHLPCLVPQHTPDKKHERVITLEEWQKSLVGSEPWAFLRGCIRSDGCAFVNRPGPYRYLTYDFHNRSAGHLGPVHGSCDMVGLQYRSIFERVRVSRRQSVEALKSHVGPKA